MAVLIGNSRYRSLQDLPCCQSDIEAMEELLEATDGYAIITTITDAAADDLKSRIRAAINVDTGLDELFFYFTGHGYQHEEEFFLCATDFERGNPHSTGLSTKELHILLREARAELVVKVVDACNSGQLLVKADSSVQATQATFNNLIQISSCRENQESLAGEAISVFTAKFREAALRKHQGPVYYMDIVNALRDTFIRNNEQTPYFVFQVTGREMFVSDARCLDALRKQVMENAQAARTAEVGQQQTTTTMKELIRIAEQKVATPEIVETFVDRFFATLIQEVSNNEFSQFFEFEVVEHSDFIETAAERFIANVLSRQDRLDEFVTANTRRVSTPGPLGALGEALFPGEHRTEHDLQLNCTMRRAQVVFTLVPKYHSLQKLVAIITCAPSLHQCYIFELGTQHRLRDFNQYSAKGEVVTRRWYKQAWTGSSDGVVEKIAARLHEVVTEHVAETEKRLSGDRPDTS